MNKKIASMIGLALVMVAVNGTNIWAHCGACGGNHETQAKKISVTEDDAKPASIIETAVAAGQFETLVAAIKAADLVETLSGEGPFTVFAPSDSAFAKLPEGTIPSLLKDTKKLTQILTYHVVPGKVTAIEAGKMKTAKTANGSEVKFAMKDAGLTIDGASIVAADIECSNGVIHVIDAVLLPN